jgi:hypothetical protein
MTVHVSSSVEIDAAPERVWAVLCDAAMPLTAPCEFRWGVLSPPRPTGFAASRSPWRFGAFTASRCAASRPSPRHPEHMDRRRIWQRIRKIWITRAVLATVVMVVWSLVAYRASDRVRSSLGADAECAGRLFS